MTSDCAARILSQKSSRGTTSISDASVGQIRTGGDPADYEGADSFNRDPWPQSREW